MVIVIKRPLCENYTMLFNEKVEGVKLTQSTETPNIGIRRYPVIMPSFFQHLSWGPIQTAMKLFCSFKIEGIENITGLKGGVVIASNHISELDPLLISACFPYFSNHLPLYYVSREKDFYRQLELLNVQRNLFLRFDGSSIRLMSA